MPKPVKKSEVDPSQPGPNFFPDYYCPECEKPTVKSSPSARPSIWHPECRPPKDHPRRLMRICPGCGKRWRLEPGPYVGQPSAFCNETWEECKLAYARAQEAMKGRMKRGDLQPHDRYYCCLCKQLVTYVPTRRQFKMRVCYDCFLSENRRSEASQDHTCRIGTCEEQVNQQDKYAKREHLCPLHLYRYSFFRSVREETNQFTPAFTYPEVMYKVEFESAPGDNMPENLNQLNPHNASDHDPELDVDFMERMPDSAEEA